MNKQLEAWRSDLIDFSRRNNLLNQDSRTVKIVFSNPAAETIFTTSLSGKAWKIYRPEIVDEVSESSNELWNPNSLDIDLDDIAPSLSVPEKPIKLQSDEVETEDHDRNKLEAKLRTLRRRSEQEYLDKGLRIIYLAFGTLEWTDKEEVWNSPIILVPIELSKNSEGQFSFKVNDEEDVVVNPALLEKLKDALNITVDVNFDEETPLATIDAFKTLCSDRKNWKVHLTARIGTYSFQKEVMYRDLLVNAEKIAESGLVQDLAFGSASEKDYSFEYSIDKEFDEKHPPSSLLSILDADSTQRQAIVAAVEGKSFVIDGPPGTGKSQTIANIISELIGHGKSVLFVSEKAAALEVVHKRLTAAGLGSFLLPLHSQKVSRKSFATLLMKAANERVSTGKKISSTDLEKLTSTQKNLSAYVGALNAIREPLGISLFTAIGEHAQLDEFPISPPPGDSINSDMEPSRFVEITDSALRLSRVWKCIDAPDDVVWRGISDPKKTREKIAQIAASLENTRSIFDTAISEGENVADDAGISAPGSLEELRNLLVLGELSKSTPNAPSAWLSSEDVDKFTHEFNKIFTVIQDLQSSEDLLNESFQMWEMLSETIGDDLTSAIQKIESKNMKLPSGDLSTKELSAQVEQAENALIALSDSVSTAKSLEKRFGSNSVTMTITRAKTLASAAKLAASSHRPESSWFTATGVKKALDTLNSFVPTFQEYWQKAKDIEPHFKNEVLSFDISAIWDSEKGEPIVGLFSGDGRRNRKQLGEFSKSGKLTADGKQAIKTLVEMQQLAKDIEPTQTTNKILGEHYYKGVNTDMAALLDAIETAKQVLNIIGEKDAKQLADALGRASLDVVETATKGESIIAAIEEFDASIIQLRGGKVITDQAITTVIDAESKNVDFYKEFSTIVNFGLSTGSDRTVENATKVAANRSIYFKSLDKFNSSSDHFSDFLGSLYQGRTTDLDALKKSYEWVISVRAALPRTPSVRLADRLLNQGVAHSLTLESLLADADKSISEITSLFDNARKSELLTEFEQAFDVSFGLMDSLASGFDQIDDAISFNEEFQLLKSFGLADCLDFLIKQKITSDKIVGTISKSIYGAWIDAVINDDKNRLSPLDKKSRDSEVETFAQIDGKLKQHAAALVAETGSNARPKLALGKMGILKRQAELKTRHMRIPDLLDETKEIVHDIVPCFMMSPLSVSTFLPPDLTFDVVIFDEASQIMTSNAVNSVYRGRQLIVAGDDKQMPPSSLFATSSSDGDDGNPEDELDDFESLLNQANAGGLQNIRLQWHYRSRHESLITYSNQSFYEGKLVTYPSPLNYGDTLGVSFVYVPDGVYLRGGRRTNPIEAKKVVERIIHHADTNPQLTLGVVAFSLAQADEIENALEVALKNRPDLEDYFVSDRLDGFFIKNLANVQGDERDIIIFSVGYGKDEHGKLTMNFGPEVMRDKGWRRLNVAFTRARCRVELVASITAADFTSETNVSVNHLRRYFDYADRGIAALAFESERSTGDAESPFEEAVIQYIRSIGYDVDSQVGQAGYRIDMAITNPDHPGSYILGIECDGAAYHSSEIARDRDRLRQEVLEGLGWTLYRIWGPTWYRSRATAESDLKAAIELAMSRRSITPSTIDRRDSQMSNEVVNNVKTVEIEMSDVPDWIEPYFNNKEGLPSIQANNGVYTHSSVEDFLVATIRGEGPMDRALLQKRFAARIGQTRTKKIQDYVNDRLVSLDNKKLIQWWQPDAVGLVGQNPFRVRHPLANDPLTRRDAKSYPLTELVAAIYNIVEEVGEIESEDLLNVVSKKLLGVHRLTTEWRDRIEEAVDKTVSWGWISKANETFVRAAVYQKGSEKPWFRQK